jgi:GAF domain-containing protein
MLSLVDHARNEVKAVAGVAVSADQIKRARHPLNSTDIMADIVRTGKTEVLTGWDQRFDEALYQDEGHADWTRLFAPIVLRRENVGLVEAGFNRTRRAQIDDGQIRLLRAFIDQTALALDNAHRYQASQRAARREALIKEITTKVRASTDLEMILQTTVKEIGEALGSKRTYVQLISEANGEPQADHEAKYNEPSL